MILNQAAKLSHRGDFLENISISGKINPAHKAQGRDGFGKISAQYNCLY